MNGLVDRLIAERRAQGDAADTTDLLGRMLSGVDKASGPGPARLQHPRAVHHLPHRGARDDLGPAVLRGLLPAQGPGRPGPGAGRGRRGAGERRVAHVRAGAPADLHPPGPGRVAAVVADRTGVQPLPLRGHRDRRTVRHTGAHPDHGAHPALHRDPAVWGPDAAEFNPEHMAPERLAAISPNVYKPFGTGQRGLHRRQFALQEAMLVLGMLLQRFDLVDDRELPAAGRRPRSPSSPTTSTSGCGHVPTSGSSVPAPHPLPPPGRSPPPTGARRRPRPAQASLVARHGTPLLVLFGSNLGTAESIAARLAQEGTERGFDVTLAALDDRVDDAAGPRRGPSSSARPTTAPLPTTPPRSAGGSAAPAPEAAAGVSYSVFGCGNTEWAATYQAVPTLIDAQLAAHGAHRVHPRGEGNAAADFDAAYRAWHADLWSDLAAALDLPAEVAAVGTGGPRLSITLTNRQLTNPVIVSYQALPAQVRQNRELIRRRRRRRPAAVDPPPRDRPAAGLVVPGRGPPRGPPPQQRRPDPAGDGPVRARRRAVRHDHPEQRHPHPPADRRTGATAGRARQLRGAAGRRHPGRPRGPRPLHRRPRAAGGPGGHDR